MAESGLLRISKEDRSLLQNLFLSASTKRSSHPRHAESAESRMASRLSDDPSTRSSDEVIKYEQLEEHDSMPTHTTTSVEPERNANPSHLLVTMLVALLLVSPQVGHHTRLLTIQQQMSFHAATNQVARRSRFLWLHTADVRWVEIPHSDLIESVGEIRPACHDAPSPSALVPAGLERISSCSCRDAFAAIKPNKAFGTARHARLSAKSRVLSSGCCSLSPTLFISSLGRPHRLHSDCPLQQKSSVHHLTHRGHEHSANGAGGSSHATAAPRLPRGAHAAGDHL